MKHYAERDPEGLGRHYTTHVNAMTEEGLHSKAAIAAELAHRDMVLVGFVNRCVELERMIGRCHEIAGCVDGDCKLNGEECSAQLEEDECPL